MRKRITKRVVDTTAPAEKDSFVWDSDLTGFGLKVTPNGRKVYVLQYRLPGSPGLLIGQRTQIINALRGPLAEFGVIAPQGPSPVQQLIAEVEDSASRVPDLEHFHIESPYPAAWR